ncbi:hypothetical protein BDV93DRAFT_575583 [Ceratobasidium sp. AG-I]|nr:hypothetical protein BDV93DRAFT_575583 [Ceratobasidium sp. AG-I]
MSFAVASKVSEPSYQSSKRSSGRINPRDPIRLLFPDGWDNMNSDVFEWYNFQPLKFFREIKYYKEPQGVGHEFVVLPLQDTGGAPTGQFCRVERMANPAQQLASIGEAGTEAYDYIQSFDSIQPSTSEPSGPLRGACLVAEITLTRDFDLYDVLAICSAIHDHPQARRYTLQQYNCYFYCWTILLTLSRRSTIWEEVALQQMSDIRAAILQSVAVRLRARDAKLAHTLSSAYEPEKDPAQSLLYTALMSELFNPDFSRALHRALSSILWVHSGQIALKHGLEDRSKVLAGQTLELLIGGLEVGPGATLKNSVRRQIDLGPLVDAQEILLKAQVIFYSNMVDAWIKTLEQESQVLRRKYANNQILSNPSGVGKRRALKLAGARWSSSLIAACAVFPLGIYFALQTAVLFNKIAVHRKTNKGIRVLGCIGNTIRFLPCSIRACSKVTPVVASMINSDQKSEYNEADGICDYFALELTTAELLQEFPKQDGPSIRAVIFQFLVSLAQDWNFFRRLSPKQVWQWLLWDFLGDTITAAILEVILDKQATEFRFDCLQPAKIKEPQVKQPASKTAPIIQLQQFIEERIVRLSKRDIDHAPIIKHIRVPAMPPPLKSQEQMKNVLEQIWRTASVGKRFREQDLPFV